MYSEFSFSTLVFTELFSFLINSMLTWRPAKKTDSYSLVYADMYSIQANMLVYFGYSQFLYVELERKKAREKERESEELIKVDKLDTDGAFQ